MPSLTALLAAAARASAASLSLQSVRRLSSSPLTRNAVHDRLKVLGDDAAKPTLDIDPFAKSARLGRPTSPHLTIYQPQLTWYISGAFRVTAAALAVGFYGIAAAYAVVPVTSTALVAAVHSLPPAIILLGKLALAAPISFHFFNGIRHLLWDTGSFLSLKGVYNTGYTVLALSAVTTIALALFL
ncbi:hypothetical protein BC831DRAFT_448661 [Entophlyctis helioformis]|nr:hypothetical protein BC831DRAFT_448661 [Entophlyctis helioformis]